MVVAHRFYFGCAQDVGLLAVNGHSLIGNQAGERAIERQLEQGGGRSHDDV